MGQSLTFEKKIPDGLGGTKNDPKLRFWVLTKNIHSYALSFLEYETTYSVLTFSKNCMSKILFLSYSQKPLDQSDCLVFQLKYLTN